MRRIFLACNPLESANRRAKHRILGLVVIVAVTVAACGGIDRSDDAGSSTSQEDDASLAELPPTAIPIGRTPTPIPTNTPEPTPVWTVDGTVIDAMLDPEDGVFGIVLMSDSGEVMYSRNGDTPFVTASVYKTVVLADILKRVETGEINLEDELVISIDVFPTAGEESDTYFGFDEVDGSHTVRELLYAMGAYSSNVSARTLLKLTSPEQLTETAHDIGMDRTYVLTPLEDVPYWPPEPGADSPPGDIEHTIAFLEALEATDGQIILTTPNDLATYFAGLLDGATVSPYVSAQILSILRENRIDDRIPYLLDGNLEIANKPGNLLHVVNDAGIIFTDTGPRIVVGLSQGNTWDGRAREAIQRIALIAIEETDISPIPVEAMEEGYFPDIEWGVADNPADVIADPPA